jgi:30S ribosomal protein S31
MGKGDKKSKKGKIAKGSFGNSRRKKAIKAKLKRSTLKKPAAAVEGDAKQKRTIKKKAEA